MKTNPGCATIWGVIALAVGGQAVAQAPTITGFAPTTGPANMVVVVSGTNFSAPLNFQNPFVLLNGQAAPVSSFSNNDLLFSVPALATSGPITVTTAFGPVTSTGSFSVLSSGTPPANDDFANAQVLTGASGWVSGSTAYATKEAGEPNHAGNPGGASVWFSWTPATSGLYLFDPAGTGPAGNFATGSDFGVLLGIYTGTAVNSLNLVTNGFSSSPAPSYSNATMLNGVAGTTYAIAIDGYNGVMGNYYLTWSPLMAPTITGFSPTTGSPGQTVSITGTGFAPGTIVTFFNGALATLNPPGIVSSSAINGVVIPPSATTGPITVATDAGFGTSSANFTVIAGPPPAFTAQPGNQNIIVGGTVTFNVTASAGFGATSYQWQISPSGSTNWTNLSDGGEYAGSATASLVITGVTADLNGAQFQCVVGNGISSATSNSASLTVQLPAGFPTITMQPQPQDGSAGGSVTFTVSASGTPTPTYQWVKTGVNIPGATSDVLTLNGLQASDVGSYAVVVTNSLGSVTSDAAGICELMCTFGGHSYELAPGAMQWNDAEAWAVSQGGHLVAVNSQSEQDFLLQSFGAVLPYWIGLSDQSTGIWTGNRSRTPIGRAVSPMTPTGTSFTPR